jgi:hypothetical protein
MSTKVAFIVYFVGHRFTLSLLLLSILRPHLIIVNLFRAASEPAGPLPQVGRPVSSRGRMVKRPSAAGALLSEL